MAPRELVTDWQLECAELKERGARLLESGQWADCCFSVGSGRAERANQPAHKLMLAAASPVFEAMLFGALAEGRDPICVPDMDPDAFYAMLEYIYTDNINIDSCAMACGVYYAAQKYMLPQLKEVSSTYLSYNLEPDDALRVYELARLFGDDKLMKDAVFTMRNQTSDILQASSFEDARLDTLVELFSMDTLNVESELELFDAAVSYARVQVTRAEPSISQQQTAETASGTIRSALKQIHFLAVNPQEFAEHKELSALLTDSEILALVMNMSSKEAIMPMPSGFSTSRLPRNLPFQCDDEVVDVNNTRIEYTFRTIVHNFSTTDRHYSDTFHVRKLPWRLHVRTMSYYTKPVGGQLDKRVEVYLQCNWTERGAAWSCPAAVEIRILSTRTDTKPYRMAKTLVFSSALEHCSWGSSIDWDQLVDPANGYIAYNTLTLEVHVRTEEPEPESDPDEPTSDCE